MRLLIGSQPRSAATKPPTRYGQASGSVEPMAPTDAAHNATIATALSCAAGSAVDSTRAAESAIPVIRAKRNDATGPLVTASAIQNATRAVAMQRTRRGVEPGARISQPAGPDT